jgi:hypothetical protein
MPANVRQAFLAGRFVGVRRVVTRDHSAVAVARGLPRKVAMSPFFQRVIQDLIAKQVGKELCRCDSEGVEVRL